MDFDNIYMLYFPKLVRFSKEYVLREEDAENIVQDIFLFVWDNYKDVRIENLNAFFFRLVKNRSIDFLRQKITRVNSSKQLLDMQLQEFTLKMQALEDFNESLSDEDVDNLINCAIESLPEKCKEIFVLNKIEGLKYNEIAEKLSISPHTVKNQVAIALKKVKKELKDHLPLFIFLIG